MPAAFSTCRIDRQPPSGSSVARRQGTEICELGRDSTLCPGIQYNRAKGWWDRGSFMSSFSDYRDESGPRVMVAPLAETLTLADRAYVALKAVIVSLNVYDQPAEVRLDERQLAQDLGISRTPVREAMAQLEREGFVRSVPRRGVYVVRKTKQQVIELITAWAALESMAARLITQNARDEDIAHLRAMFATFENGTLHAKLDEYSEVNIEFHQTIIRMSHNRVLVDLAENLFTHMRM